MSDPSNISLTLNQVGADDVTLGVWVEGSFPSPLDIPFIEANATTLGFVFSHPNYANVDGYDLQSPRLFTDTDRQAVLTIVTDTPIEFYGLYLFGLPATELWSNSNLPRSNIEYPSISSDMYLVHSLQASDWAVTGAVYTLALDIDFNTAYRSPFTFDASGTVPLYREDRTLVPAILMASLNWTGRLGMALIRNPNSLVAVPFVSTISSITMTSWEVPWWTGEAGGRANTMKRVRVALDSRYGMPAYSSDLIEDDYRPGVWVRPTDWDPEDPQPEYIGSPSEGETDDVPVK